MALDAFLKSKFTRVTSDSREVVPGALFVAVRGGSQDGHLFIDQAIAQGAAAVIGEEPRKLAVPYLQVTDARFALARAAAVFYGHPSRSLRTVGVTGTSGKTTTTYLIESILQAAGEKVGLIGTVEFRFGAKRYPSTHTTPGAVELQRLLAQMRHDGCTAVVMEVSSHALSQRRVAEVAFDGVVFTNLTPEHLDFHPDLEHYFLAKAILFTDLVDSSRAAGKNPAAAIRAGIPFGDRLLGLSRARNFGFTPFGPTAHFTVGWDGIRGNYGGVAVESRLTGAFNADNLAGAIQVCLGMGIAPDAIARGVRALPGVPGRLEKVADPLGQVLVLVDYAHKPDALEKVLATLNETRARSGRGGRILTVFGCGGDRDRTKRPVMGRLAVDGSDLVFVTSDNPRTEDPSVIIGEIVAGLAGAANYRVEPDRRLAIRAAIAESRAGDVVLIAGKGHEDYQIIGRDKIHFDDREVAAEALSSADRRRS